jgi:hypothetical protein
MIQILMKLLHQTFARALKIKDHSKRPTQKKSYILDHGLWTHEG